MIIIVEGIDRVGKTTLCNKLSTELNIPIYKHPTSIMDYDHMDNVNETDKMLHMVDIMKLSNSNIIFDRFHLSEYAYGVVERNYNTISALHNFKLVDNELRKCNAILIIVKPTDIKMSSEEDGRDMSIYWEHMLDALSASRLKHYLCDYNSIDKMVNIIKEVSNEII